MRESLLAMPIECKTKVKRTKATLYFYNIKAAYNTLSQALPLQSE